MRILQETYLWFHTEFKKERGTFFLWLPVFFAIGITVYFSLPEEPNILIGLYVQGIFFVIFVTLWRITFLRLFLIAILLANAGYLCANYRAISVNSPKIENKRLVTEFSGRIERIEVKEHGKRYLIKPLVIQKLSAVHTPRFIRISSRIENQRIRVGDIIFTKAVLSAPPQPVYPGSYNFSFNAYFQQIGAIGYTIRDFYILKQAPLNRERTVNYMRAYITQKFYQYMPTNTASVAAALLVGEKSGIPEKTLEFIRKAGLAHLLAISGMHVALIIGICFFVTRKACSYFHFFSLRYDNKKLAACAAFCFGLLYLLLSGAPISAQRAFFMACLFLLAILLDCLNTPLRAVAIAAFAVLAITPESLFSPSFQMSFAAVIALISAFDAIYSKLNFENTSIIKRSLLYAGSLLLSSLVAGSATTPFTLYHFNQATPYSILSNMLAIPLTTFIIMPLGLLSLLLISSPFASLCLLLFSYAISLLLRLADYISALPYSMLYITAPSLHIMLCFVFGSLILCLCTTRLRFVGLGCIAMCCFLKHPSQPDIVIHENRSLFALKDQKEFLINRNMPNYTEDIWKKRLAINSFNKVSERSYCDAMACTVHKNGKTATIVKDPWSIAEACHTSHIVINLTTQPNHCSEAEFYISYWDLYRRGTHSVFFEGSIVSSISNIVRLWE